MCICRVLAIGPRFLQEFSGARLQDRPAAPFDLAANRPGEEPLDPLLYQVLHYRQGFPGIPRDSQGFPGIRRDSQGFAGIRRDSQGFPVATSLTLPQMASSALKSGPLDWGVSALVAEKSVMRSAISERPPGPAHQG